MQIIDSLFVGNRFFSVGVVWTTLSLFASAVRGGRFICMLQWTQPGAVVRLIGSEHGEEGVQQFPGSGVSY